MEAVIEIENGVSLTIKEIVENKLNVKVKSYNHETKQIEYRPVLNWFVNKDYNDDGTKIIDKDIEWYEIQLQKPIILNNKKIYSLKLTGNHYVFVKNINAYRRVDELSVNDILCLSNK